MTRTPLILVMAAVAGVVFGFGLALSEMINPRRVLAFLDVAGRWDPTLLFVMIGAIPVAAVGYAVTRRQSRPLFSERFFLPERRDIDARLLAGAALFGIGWGLAGYCPGPVVAMLSLQWQEPVVFIAAMLTGSQLYRGMTA